MSDNASSWSIEQVVDLLHNVDLFEGLSDEDVRRIAAIVGETSVAAGSALFEEGEPADALYVVFEGRMEIAKARPDGTPERLAVRRAGEAFGEAGLLSDTPRFATARALDAAHLVVIGREAFQELLGGDSLALRMVRALSQALRRRGVRVTGAEKPRTPEGDAREDAESVSRAMQAGLLPHTAPQIEGYDVAAGTTTEESGRGSSIWDWIDMGGGRVALVSLDVRQEGFPPAYHLGAARALLRALAQEGRALSEVLARANDVLSGAAVEGVDQFVDVGILATDADGIEWASAGRVPGGVIRREGSFEDFGAHGPPLGMMGGFKYDVQRFAMNVGDTVFVLSHAPQGLVLGAADLVAQLHGKPGGEVVETLHRAIRMAQGGQRTETSVLYVRKH